MGLASRLAPPLRLPGSHFALALAFWLAGSVGLVLVAPDLAGGRFTAPRVAAVTHLFTLGWVTTSILGALYQFLPVALGTPIRWQRLAWVTLVLYAPGLPLFLFGLVRVRLDLMLPGAVAFGTGLLLLILRRVPLRSPLVVPLIGLMVGGVIAAFATFLAYRYNFLQSLAAWTNGDFSRVLRGRYELLWLSGGLTLLAYIAADARATRGASCGRLG